MTGETVLILDFGGQYKELIARRVREHGVYSEIRSCKMPVEEIRAMAPKGIIFTGGPDSVYRDDSPCYSDAGIHFQHRTEQTHISLADLISYQSP